MPEENTRQIEESCIVMLDFGKVESAAKSGKPVMPAVIQHADTKDVLMVGYMSREALEETISTRRVTFWSTSRSELWRKGESSGNRFVVDSIFVNCEQNSLLVKARPEKGGVCHTLNKQTRNRATCYYRKLEDMERLTFDGMD